MTAVRGFLLLLLFAVTSVTVGFNFPFCSLPRAPQGGHVSLGRGGAVATFTCRSGYELEGRAVAVCVGGKWSSAPPTCSLLTSAGQPHTPCSRRQVRNIHPAHVGRLAIYVYPAHAGRSGSTCSLLMSAGQVAHAPCSRRQVSQYMLSAHVGRSASTCSLLTSAGQKVHSYTAVMTTQF